MTDVNARLPGRELDLEIAVRVMGWRWPAGVSAAASKILSPEGVRMDLIRVPHFSTNMAAAWRVAEKLRREGWSMVAGGNHVGWSIAFSLEGGDPGSGSNAAMPLAICIAALKALEAQACS